MTGKPQATEVKRAEPMLRPYRSSVLRSRVLKTGYAQNGRSGAERRPPALTRPHGSAGASPCDGTPVEGDAPAEACSFIYDRPYNRHRSWQRDEGRKIGSSNASRAGNQEPLRLRSQIVTLKPGKMVPATGLEPVRCYSLEPESSASANSATWASFLADHLQRQNYIMGESNSTAS